MQLFVFNEYVIFKLIYIFLLSIDPRNHNEEDAIEFLDTFNEMAMEVYFEDVSAAWTYQTDITEEHQQKMVSVIENIHNSIYKPS